MFKSLYFRARSFAARYFGARDGAAVAPVAAMAVTLSTGAGAIALSTGAGTVSILEVGEP